MRYSRKQYVDAYQYTGDQLEVFIAISNDNTHIDKKGRLQFYVSNWEHLGVPKGYWIINDGGWKVYNDEVFQRLYSPEPELQTRYLRHVRNNTYNPVYPDRPYPNNIHAIKFELGLSNRELGEMCGLGYNIIAYMDRGDRPVTDEYKELIEKATNFEVVRFYN